MNERISTLSHLILPLLEWFRDNQRTLPWRSDPTPYHVWVSEIMLQQTRVAAVLAIIGALWKRCLRWRIWRRWRKISC